MSSDVTVFWPKCWLFFSSGGIFPFHEVNLKRVGKMKQVLERESWSQAGLKVFLLRIRNLPPSCKSVFFRLNRESNVMYVRFQTTQQWSKLCSGSQIKSAIFSLNCSLTLELFTVMIWRGVRVLMIWHLHVAWGLEFIERISNQLIP